MVGLLLFSGAMAFSLSLVLASTPLYLGVWILLLAFMVALLLGLFAGSWLGFLMFLIYVGGLLVMFAYFVALAPNQVLEGKYISFFFFFTIVVVFCMICSCYLLDGVGFSYSFCVSMFYFLLSNNIVFFILLSVVLFFALVAVVKLCSFSSSPLRPFGSYV